MSKKICKLEKETSSWKQRWEKSHQALLEMAADKQQRDSELALATRQLAQLQKLCRTLQAERTSLLAQLKAEGAAKTGGNFLPVSGIHNWFLLGCHWQTDKIINSIIMSYTMYCS
jgi:hypothetical protein